MSASEIILPLRVGARTVGRLRRRLVRVACALQHCRNGLAAPLPALDPDDDGYLLTSVPAGRIAAVARAPGFRAFVRQRYPRYYAALDRGWDGWCAALPAKAKAAMLRKCRRFAKASGGAIDIRCYRTPAELAEFHTLALPLAARTYQARLLDAALPDDPAFLIDMHRRGARDAVRAWLLFKDGAPIAYLYAPAEGDTLIYAYLGYDPAAAALSPGTVLQAEAMRMLIDEQRFRWFDFTEGDGQHKRQFATGSVPCADVLLVRPTLANLAAAHALNGFDAGIAGAKLLVHRVGAQRLVRGLRH